MSPNHPCPQVRVWHPEPIFAAGVAAALRTSGPFEVFVGSPLEQPGDAERDSVTISICDHERGVELARRWRVIRAPRPVRERVVVVAARPREIDVQAALAQGVLGYLVAACDLEELLGAVRAAVDGRRFLCQATARQLANSMVSESLTAREFDVLELLARGRCNKAIAAELAIAVGTVKAHVRGILAKLNARSRTEAASIAAHRGLLEESSWRMAAAA